MMTNSLKDKHIVFTGSLYSMKREEAIRLSVEKGAKIQSFVTEKTDILILAPKQLDIFGADIRSRKLIKAEALIKSGVRIEIISEKEFLSLLVK